jgi:hypothetical protein
MNWIEENFLTLSNQLIEHLRTGEHLVISLSAEQSQFTRFNRTRVRQTGVVHDGSISLNLLWNQREIFSTIPFTGDRQVDFPRALVELEDLREQIPTLPENPYLALPENHGSSREVYQGSLLTTDEVIAAILTPIRGQDMGRYYSAGTVIRDLPTPLVSGTGLPPITLFWITPCLYLAVMEMIGRSRVFMPTPLGIRTSIYCKWERSLEQLEALNRPMLELDKGSYRTYFAPSATAELVGMLTWAVGEASLQQGSSALLKLRNGEVRLSPQFSLSEDFSLGNVPRFNSLGEIAVTHLDIIRAGQWQNSLVSSRSAKEYGVESNGASLSETMRSPVMASGDLAPSDVLSALDTGLFLSNLHYLNWSDRNNARITGMTRYACFWVENGTLSAPIKNLRFDDSVYSFFGDNLERLTSHAEFIASTDTYGQRSLGGISAPGLLVKNFTFTL